MNKKVILVIIASFIVGFLGFHAYNGTLPQLTAGIVTAIQPAVTWLQGGIAQIQTIIGTIPPAMLGLIVAGVSTAFTVFFAWTKTRAMTKLTQMQQQATQLQGEKAEVQAQSKIYLQQAESYKTQLGTQSNLAFEDIIKARDEAQSLVLQKQQELAKLQQDYNTMERTYINAIQELKQNKITVIK